MAGLAAAVLVAWFWPEWYAARQDEQIEGESVLSVRENIRFLDVDSLDVADRLWILKNRTEPWLNDTGMMMEYSDEQVDLSMEHWKRMVWKWEENHLIPKGCYALLEQFTEETKRALDGNSLESKGLESAFDRECSGFCPDRFGWTGTI